MSAYGHFDVNKIMIVFPIMKKKLLQTDVCRYLFGTCKNSVLLGVCLCYVLFCHLIRLSLKQGTGNRGMGMRNGERGTGNL